MTGTEPEDIEQKAKKDGAILILSILSLFVVIYIDVGIASTVLYSYFAGAITMKYTG